jgi:uncharacterized coiled-coil DUF342 family protein
MKKKITLNRHHKISDKLSVEAIENKKLIEQIKELKDQRNKNKKGPEVGYSLKSQNWYSQKLYEELNQKETKQKFIEEELKELRKKIAVEHQNMTKAENKANGIRKKEASLLETKREFMTPKINKL